LIQWSLPNPQSLPSSTLLRTMGDVDVICGTLRNPFVYELDRRSLLVPRPVSPAGWPGPHAAARP
jgi:hypothetical protein